MRLLAVTLVLFGLAACEADIKEGWFSCVDDSGCPADWYCHADSLCYSSSPDTENTAEKCANGLDDDARGGADCLDAACVDGGFCGARETSCDPYAQTGCPAGMGCYQRFRPDSTWGTECRLAGHALANEPCDTAGLTATSPHPCEDGNGCYYLASQHGTCGSYCRADLDCSAGALCEGDTADRPGLCPTPCNPNQAIACPTGFACASYALLDGWRFDAGGARHICVLASLLRDATAAAGDACIDPPTGTTPPASICRIGTVCVPAAGGARCHALCELAASAPCDANLICHRPTDAAYVNRPLFSAYGEALGYCL